MRRARSALLALPIVLVPMACSSDGDDGPKGDGTISKLVASVPQSAAAGDGQPFARLVLTDYDKAGELAGLQRPSAGATRDERADWFLGLTGLGDGAIVASWFPQVVENATPADMRDDHGWIVEDVTRFVELQSTNTFTVLETRDITADDLDGALDPAEDDDGLWSTSRRTRQMYTALDGHTLALSGSTDEIDDWRDGKSTFGDDDDVMSMTAELDEHEAYAAEILPTAPSSADLAVLPEFDALALGLAVDGTTPVGVFVYHFGSDDDAEDAVEAIEDLFAGTGDDTSAVARFMDDVEVEVHGTNVVVTGDITDRPTVIRQLLDRFDVATISA